MVVAQGGATVRDDEFAAIMRQWYPAQAPGQRVAVGVSGGSDSMALLLLARRWAGPDLLALTVDHGLRPEAAAEAQQVAKWCADLGVEHQILEWRHNPKPVSDIQAQARNARYRLLAAECQRMDIQTLLMAHHQDDQAETFLLRLGRGSGVDGLSAMATEIHLPIALGPGLRVLRPLLGIAKTRLTATTKAAGQSWIEDPSNQDPHFARPRMRAAMGAFADLGISAGRVAATAHRMQRARAALEHATNELLRTSVHIDPAGFARVLREPVAAAPEEIALRALSRVLMTVGAREYPARMQRLENLYGWLMQGAKSGGRTLSGCRVVAGSGDVIIAREPAAIGPEVRLQAGERGYWDGRFYVQLADGVACDRLSLAVRAVAADGVRQVMLANVKPPYNAMPRMAYRTTPGLWCGDQLLAAPLLGFIRSDQREVACGFSATFAPIRQLAPISALALS